MRQQSLLPQTFPSTDKEWYFAFSKSLEDVPWYFKLATWRAPEGLRHVYAFSQTGQFVLFVEPSLTKVELVVKYPNDGSDYLCGDSLARELVSHGHTVVKHKYQPNIRGKKSLFNFLPTCVSVVKVATGYSSLAVTPVQLLGCLLNNGAKLM